MNGNIGQEIADLLGDAANQYGQKLKEDKDVLAQYINERATHLLRSYGQPGYNEALAAERDSIALMAAGRAISAADAFDARVLGILEGALGVALRAVAVG